MVKLLSNQHLTVLTDFVKTDDVVFNDQVDINSALGNKFFIGSSVQKNEFHLIVEQQVNSWRSKKVPLPPPPITVSE